MILKADNKLDGYNHQDFLFENTFWMLDAGATNDPKFMVAIDKSLQGGMRFPVLVAEHDIWEEWFLRTHKYIHLFPKPIKTHFKYRVVLGNNRCHFAAGNGYKGIEGVLSNDLDKDHDEYLKITRMEYGRDY